MKAKFISFWMEFIDMMKSRIQIKGKKGRGESEDTLKRAKGILKGLLKDDHKVLLDLIRVSTKKEVKEVKGDLYYTIDGDEIRQNKDKESLLMRPTKRETLKAVADLGR